MAYLDEDILYNNVEEKYKSANGKARAAYSDVLDTICEMPRADVVPKSEVDLYRKQVDELEDKLASTYDKLENAKAEVARYIFDEIEAIIDDNSYKSYLPNSSLWSKEYKIRQIITELAELKKKYTESENGRANSEM